MLCGHQYASSQKHGSALREYARAHAQLPDEPLISLSIGASLMRVYMSYAEQLEAGVASLSAHIFGRLYVEALV